MKLFLSILTLLFIPFSLFAINDDLSVSKFTDQETIVSLSPAPAQTDIYPDINVDVVFNVGLDEGHVKPNSVRLRHIDGKKIDTEGTISYIADEKRLRFIPNAFLQPGVYEVDIKDIKAAKGFKHNEIKNITYRFKVADVTPVSLKIIPTPVEVKESSTIDLKASVLYSDGTDKQVDTAVWSSKDSNILSVEQNATATGVKEGETTVTASYKGLTSKATQALVYLEINGHRLPLEPDPIINNSTLLGIDVNSNGVRDDVERLIIIEEAKNPNFPKTHTAISLQYAWAWQKMIENPVLETRQHLEKASACQWYWFNKKTKDIRGYANGRKWRVEHRNILGVRLEDKIFNTKERIQQRFKFNEACSGHIFKSAEKNINACRINIDELGE